MFVVATFDVAHVNFQQNGIPAGWISFLKFSNSRTVLSSLPSISRSYCQALSLHLFLDFSTDCWVSRSMKASFCPRSKSLPTILRSNFYCCCCWFQSSGYYWQFLARTCLCPFLQVHASFWPCMSLCQDKPYFVTSWRAFFDSCSDHGSERFFIKLFVLSLLISCCSCHVCSAET